MNTTWLFLHIGCPVKGELEGGGEGEHIRTTQGP